MPRGFRSFASEGLYSGDRNRASDRTDPDWCFNLDILAAFLSFLALSVSVTCCLAYKSGFYRRLPAALTCWRIRMSMSSRRRRCCTVAPGVGCTAVPERITVILNFDTCQSATACRMYGSIPFDPTECNEPLYYSCASQTPGACLPPGYTNP